jgi:putative redox protein
MTHGAPRARAGHDMESRAMGFATSLTLKSLEQGMRFDAAIGSFTVPFDSGPEATAPTPMQVVLAALGGCTAMDVISILRKKRQAVTGYEVVVTGEKREEHPKHYSRIEIVHRVRGRDIHPAAVEEAVRLSDTKYCSVHAMLEPRVEITSRFEILPA